MIVLHVWSIRRIFIKKHIEYVSNVFMVCMEMTYDWKILRRFFFWETLLIMRYRRKCGKIFNSGIYCFWFCVCIRPLFIFCFEFNYEIKKSQSRWSLFPNYRHFFRMDSFSRSMNVKAIQIYAINIIRPFVFLDTNIHNKSTKIQRDRYGILLLFFFSLMLLCRCHSVWINVRLCVSNIFFFS